MARRMPRFELRFARDADEALQLAETGERIRAGSPSGSVARRELTAHRVEALYETAFLRVFLAWEDFLEESFLRYLCGYRSSLGPQNLRVTKFPTLDGARIAILGARDYLVWANPRTVAARSKIFILGGLHETVLNSNLARLEAFNSIRNRVAHRSEYARKQFDHATVMLVGRRIAASSPGRFLREIAVPSPPVTWLYNVADELKSLAFQICP